MDNCVCIQTSQHALLFHSGRNWPAAPNQPWPFTTLPRGSVCTSVIAMCVSSSVTANTHLFVCVYRYIPSDSTVCLIYLQTDSSLISSPTLSFLIYFFYFFFPSSPSLYLLRSPPIHPSSKHPFHVGPPIPFDSSTHRSICICFPAGETIS